jgi:aryl-alcohol dehydrogenase-like predicted oxidoreductase
MTRLPIRRLGTTGLDATPIGLGLAALGRPAYITPGREDDYGIDRSVAAMEQRCHELLDAAFAAGIRYIDTARSYGRAEAFLASWLRKRSLPEGVVTIASKWGYSYVGDWRVDARVHELKDLSAGNLRTQIAESRALLGGHLAAYQIHSATLESGVLDDRAVIDGLRTLRSDGLAIGLTVTGPRQADTIRRALEVMVDGVRLFQLVQATWNMLERSAGDALADASDAGLAVIVKEALANGRLTGKDAEPGLAPLRRYAASCGTTEDVIAIAAALAQPWADVVLSGAVTVGQLASNLRALQLSHAASDWPEIDESPSEYWASRSARPWS